MRACPNCGKRAQRVIYMAAPMLLCSDSVCCTLWGLWSWLPVVLPITNGSMWAFFAYDCAYPVALWRWLKGHDDDDGGGVMRHGWGGT